MPATEPVILDIDSLDDFVGLGLVQQEGVWGAKIGDLILRYGIGIVEEMHAKWSRLGCAKPLRLMVDLKHMDTADRIERMFDLYRGLGGLAPQLITVSGLLPEQTLRKASEAVSPYATRIVVIPVQSDWSDPHCKRTLGHTRAGMLNSTLRRVAKLDIGGITCPANLLRQLPRLKVLSQIEIIATGTRSAGVPAHNHLHPEPPEAALAHKATRVVIGREVTESQDPTATLAKIVRRCTAA